MQSDAICHQAPEANCDKLAASIQLAKLGLVRFTPVACVYVMANRITGRVYVGQTVNMDRRVKAHMTYMKTGRHTANVLDDFAAHGAESFGFAVVHACEEGELDKLEREYIVLASTFADCYNVATPSVNGGRRRASNAIGKAAAELRFVVMAHPDDHASLREHAAKLNKRRERKEKQA